VSNAGGQGQRAGARIDLAADHRGSSDGQVAGGPDDLAQSDVDDADRLAAGARGDLARPVDLYGRAVGDLVGAGRVARDNLVIADAAGDAAIVVANDERAGNCDGRAALIQRQRAVVDE